MMSSIFRPRCGGNARPRSAKGTAARLLPALLPLLMLSPALCHAGSKWLVVSFFDFSQAQLGKSSFKALRLGKYQHPCWKHFGEIKGIKEAYIENPPKGLNQQTLLDAIHGSGQAAGEFASQLKSERMFGAFAFVPDPSGRFATVQGINYQDGAISISASIPISGRSPIPDHVMSKALCEAAASMD